MKNRLIVFEGIDGTGKSTISRKINKELLKLGISSICFEDLEVKNEGFNIIKSFIVKKTSIDASLFFYVASAIHKSQKIELLLKDNWVVCDRYVYSTLAYHKARGANLNLIPSLEKLSIILPDFYFLLKVDEGIRIKRLELKKETEPLDFYPKTPGSFFDQIEQCFLEYNPIVLDNSDPKIDKIIEKIIDIINKKD